MSIFERRIFLRKCSEILPDIFGGFFCGSENIPQNFRTFPAKENPRRAKGAQGEEFPQQKENLGHFHPIDRSIDRPEMKFFLVGFVGSSGPSSQERGEKATLN